MKNSKRSLTASIFIFASMILCLISLTDKTYIGWIEWGVGIVFLSVYLFLTYSKPKNGKGIKS